MCILIGFITFLQIYFSDYLNTKIYICGNFFLYILIVHVILIFIFISIPPLYNDLTFIFHHLYLLANSYQVSSLTAN